jgi:glycerophosphoryl diester phosphodiesterase
MVKAIMLCAMAAACAVCRGASAPPADPISYVAHQGEEALAPSHSRAAYRLAAEHGLDYLKLDLRETKDGEVVMSHDRTLKNVMGWDAKIRDLTLSEIREKGRCRPRGGYADEKIVTLREALAFAKGMKKGIWLDFKDFSLSFAPKVFRIVEECGFSDDRIMVATFNKHALKWLHKNRPSVRRVAHTIIFREEDGSFRFNGSDGKDKVYPTLEALGDALEEHARSLGLSGFNLPHRYKGQMRGCHTPPALVHRLRKAGYWISIWFVYEPMTGEYYRQVGVDAFVTRCKAHTFPGGDPAQAERARLMRLMAQAGDGETRVPKGDELDALMYCAWEPDIAVDMLVKAGGKMPATADEAVKRLEEIIGRK